MSHAHGTHLHGVRTLAALRARCIEEGDCWIGDEPGRTRRLWLAPALNGGRGWMATGRQMGYFLANGKHAGEGRMLFASCGCNQCWNPKHAVAWTKAEYGTWVKENARFQGLLSHKRAHGARQRSSTKLSIEKAREIRASDERQVDLAARYGVSQGVVSSVKRGETWREQARSASVFNWRP